MFFILFTTVFETMAQELRTDYFGKYLYTCGIRLKTFKTLHKKFPTQKNDLIFKGQNEKNQRNSRTLRTLNIPNSCKISTKLIIMIIIKTGFQMYWIYKNILVYLSTKVHILVDIAKVYYTRVRRKKNLSSSVGNKVSFLFHADDYMIHLKSIDQMELRYRQKVWKIYGIWGWGVQK